MLSSKILSWLDLSWFKYDLMLAFKLKIIKINPHVKTESNLNDFF